jgi:hypothetical protein
LIEATSTTLFIVEIRLLVKKCLIKNYLRGKVEEPCTLYRGYNVYYFDDCCEEIIGLENEGSVESKRKAKVLNQTMKNWLFKKENYHTYIIEIVDALDIIKVINEKLNETVILEYYDDETNPKVEVWEWILVVPWWSIIIEQKRIALDSQKKDIFEKTTVKEKKEIMKDRGNMLWSTITKHF